MSHRKIQSTVSIPGQADSAPISGIQSSLQNSPLVAAWAPTTKANSLFILQADNQLLNDGSGHVGTWTSLVNGYVASKVTASPVPVLNNALNGRPATTWDTTGYLTFDGSTTYFTSGSPFSFYAICSVVAGAGTYYQTLVALKGSGGQNFTVIASNDPNYAPLFFGCAASGGQLMIGATGTFVGGQQLILINYNGGTVTSAASWTIYQNNISLPVAPTTSGSSVAVNLNLIGSYSNNGALPFAGWNGNIYEMGSYGAVFTTQEMGFLEAYSQGKWLTP